MRFADMMALEPHGPDTYVGTGPQYPWGGLYGGQIVAQGLRAAGLTVDPDYRPHSLHAYFIRPGDADEPIRFEVDRDRNGRSFCTRRVVARQSVGVILNMAASFQIEEHGTEVQGAELPPVKAAEDIEPNTWSQLFERRYPDRPGSEVGRTVAWLRLADLAGNDPLVQACGLAYLSDDLATEAVFALHPDQPLDSALDADSPFERFQSASLDHAIWFHRFDDPGAWQLHDFRCHQIGGSRGLATGEIFSTSGAHLATVSQEVLIRKR